MSTRRLGLIGGKLGLFVTLVVGVVVVAVVMAVVLNGADGEDPEFVFDPPASSERDSLEADGDAADAAVVGLDGADVSVTDANDEGSPGTMLDDPESAAGSAATDQQGDEATTPETSGDDVADPASGPEDDPEAVPTNEDRAAEQQDSESVDLGPMLEVSPSVIRQGETVFVRLFGAEAGSVLLTVDGATTFCRFVESSHAHDTI